MNKQTFNNTTLSCIMQQAVEISTKKCHSGIISRKEDGSFHFEESVRKGRPAHNPKLYDGKYVSMVRMQNGKYQLYLKSIADDFDKERLPFEIYHEVTNALEILRQA